MKRASSIQVDELTRTASKVAEQVMAAHIKRLGAENVHIGIFPDIGLVGLIIDPIDLRQVDAAEMFDLSARITEGMGPLAQGARPVIRFERDIGTMGYFPSDPIILQEMKW